MFGYITQFDGDLFDRLERMHREMDRLYGGATGAQDIRSVTTDGFPRINVGVLPDRVDVYVYAAGLDPNAMDISLQQNLLTITGERRPDAPEGARPYRRERFNGEFRRVINLPDGVDPDKVEATYRDGILHIKVQRQEAVRPRKITVN